MRIFLTFFLAMGYVANCMPVDLVRHDVVEQFTSHDESTDDIICTDTNFFFCPKNSICDRVNSTYGTCICSQNYVTYNNGTFCGYKRQNNLVAFLLDLFLSFEFFPAGQVWACSDLSQQQTLTCRLALAQIFTSGIVGFLIWYVFLAICLSIVSIIVKNTNYSEIMEAIARLLSICIVFSSFAWWITNIVRNATNATTDANGVQGRWFSA